MREAVAVFIVFLLVSADLTPEPPPPKIVVPAAPMKKAASVLRIVADELDGAADAPDVEEHVIQRCEAVFDQNAKDFDFPGPNIITRPLARKAIRPVVKSILRYAADPSHYHEPNEHEGSTK